MKLNKINLTKPGNPDTFVDCIKIQPLSIFVVFLILEHHNN